MGWHRYLLALIIVLRLLAASPALATHSVPCSTLASPPGAVFLYSDAPNATFNGNYFAIDGNDLNFTNGFLGPMDPIWGVATGNETAAEEVWSSLTNTQKNNIQGYGYVGGSPATPSIGVVAGPSPEQIDQFVADLLSLAPPRVVTNSSSTINGGNVFGTEAQPIITHFNNPSGVTFGNGNASGYGVMIVEHSLTLNGNIDFKGLIVVRGPLAVNAVSSSVTLWGTVWTTDLYLTAGGHCLFVFSSEGLQSAAFAGAALACEDPLPTVTTTPTATAIPTPTPTRLATATPGCGALPEASCRTPTVSGAGRLSLRDAADDLNDRLAWRWTTGSSGPAAFGDPTVATDYDLCIYDATPVLVGATRIPAGTVSGSRPNWRATNRGFVYASRSPNDTDVRKLVLTADPTTGKERIVLGAKGYGIGVPALPLALPARAQLKNTAGACWETTFTAPRRNDAAKFSARTD